MRVAFPMLLVNSLDWFAGDQADLLTTYATGRRERVPLDGAVGAVQADVTAPDGTVTKTPVIDGLATFYASHVGYYDIAAKQPDGKRARADHARREPRVGDRKRYRAVGDADARRQEARGARGVLDHA